jgi:RES domain-containing protein
LTRLKTADGVRLWRLVKAGREASAWDGEGSFRFGGRWNSRGVRVVYASSSLAVALLEILVHLDPAAPLPALRAICATVPPGMIMELPKTSDKKNGGECSTSIRFSVPLKVSRQLGDEWARSRGKAVLCVPSVIVPTESNYLLNPMHLEFGSIKIGPPRDFAFDDRLRGK